MTTLTEGNIQITLPDNVTGRKFDDESHGLSHCMKAVDFIIEESDRILFVEIKGDNMPEEKVNEYIEGFKSEKLDKELQYKYRDTLLYQWASGNVGDKPIHYLVLVAIETLTDVDLHIRTDFLQRKLPLKGPPPSGKWKRPIVTSCMVFNIETWNRSLPDYSVSRI